jgi:hypothetical protein
VQQASDGFQDLPDTTTDQTPDSNYSTSQIANITPDEQDFANTTTDISPDSLSDYQTTPAAPFKPDEQLDLWLAAYTDWPTDADVSVPAGWQSSINIVRDVWTWNVSHNSVPADRASAVVDNWCIESRPIKRGKDGKLDNLDVLSFISESCCSIKLFNGAIRVNSPAAAAAAAAAAAYRVHPQHWSKPPTCHCTVCAVYACS